MNKIEKNPQIISAYEKAAQEGIDPRCIPQILDKPVPEHDEIVSPKYSKEENSNWNILYERQMKYLRTRACKEYIDGLDKFKISPYKIPSLKNLSNHLYKISGWKVARVPGLIHEKNFFEFFAPFASFAVKIMGFYGMGRNSNCGAARGSVCRSKGIGMGSPNSPLVNASAGA